MKGRRRRAARPGLRPPQAVAPTPERQAKQAPAAPFVARQAPGARPGHLVHRDPEPSMLDTYARRRQLSPRQLAAGERLAQLFQDAAWQPRLVAKYEARTGAGGLVIGGLKPGAGDALWRALEVLAPCLRREARAQALDGQHWRNAELPPLGPMAHCTIAVVAEERSAADWAKASGLQEREGITLLRAALEMLADYWSLVPE